MYIGRIRSVLQYNLKSKMYAQCPFYSVNTNVIRRTETFLDIKNAFSISLHSSFEIFYFASDQYLTVTLGIHTKNACICRCKLSVRTVQYEQTLKCCEFLEKFSSINFFSKPVEQFQICGKLSDRQRSISTERI